MHGSCGKSLTNHGNGAHVDTDKLPQFVAENNKTVGICMCKQTNNPPIVMAHTIN